MFRKILGGLLVVSIIWLTLSTVSTLHADSTSKPLASISSSLNNFQTNPDLPDINVIFKEVNQAREGEGLPALKANPELTTVAEARAKDMAEHNYYAHKDKNGKFYYDLFSKYNFSTKYSCENLDLEFHADPDAFVGSWMGSPFGHRECILNKSITDAGYAVVAMPGIQYQGSTTTGYLVVAIHSTAPTQK